MQDQDASALVGLGLLAGVVVLIGWLRSEAAAAAARRAITEPLRLVRKAGICPRCLERLFLSSARFCTRCGADLAVEALKVPGIEPAKFGEKFSDWILIRQLFR